jgi:valyl-tRNA synthetase
MPFITEEIWGYLPAEAATEDNPDSLLIRDHWPEYDENLDYSDAVARIDTAMEIIKAVRAIRVEADAAPSRKVSLIVRTDTLSDIIPHIENHICKIANVESIKVEPSGADAPDDVMLVLDGSTGQNAFEQAKQFSAVTQITSLAITKLDGTAKGGVVIGISDQLKVPVKYIGLGEGMSDLQLFDRRQFVDSLFSGK